MDFENEVFCDSLGWADVSLFSEEIPRPDVPVPQHLIWLSEEIPIPERVEPQHSNWFSDETDIPHERVESQKMNEIRDDLTWMLREQLNKENGMGPDLFSSSSSSSSLSSSASSLHQSQNQLFTHHHPQIPNAPPLPPSAYLTSSPYPHLINSPSTHFFPPNYGPPPSLQQYPLPYSFPYLPANLMPNLCSSPSSIQPRKQDECLKDRKEARVIAPKPPNLPPPNFYLQQSFSPRSTEPQRKRIKRKYGVHINRETKSFARQAKDELLTSTELQQQLEILRKKFEASEAESKLLKEKLSSTESELALLRLRVQQYDSSPTPTTMAISPTP
jgi:hypothetical protein